MTPSLPQAARVHRVLLALAGLGAIAAAALALVQRDALLPAYRFTLFACFAPPVGSLLFMLIHRLTGGQWGEALAPMLTTGARLAPWLWLLALPLLLVARRSAPPWPAYESLGMAALRAGVYAVVLFAVSAGLRRKRNAGGRTWIAPAGLLVLVFMLHALADDWLGALEPHWYSTAFALVWMTGLAVAGLALAVLCGILLGLSPRQSFAAPRAVGLDWGDLLLTAMLFWVYVAFAQFLIIWAGNVPREISWFEHRTRGAWGWVPLALFALHFVLPFGILLSRSQKRSPRALAAAAVLLLFGQLLYTAWLILPAFDVEGVTKIALCAAVFGAGAAALLDVYLRLAQRRLAPT